MTGGKWNKTDEKETCDVVRGCEKRIYYVKNTDSEIFDEAYLILRRQEKGKHIPPREIELEAMRIVNGASGGRCRGGKGEATDHGNLKAFFAGALLSALIIGAVSLILWILL